MNVVAMDTLEHIYRLADLLTVPTQGVAYRMLDDPAFADHCLITLHLIDDATATISLSQIKTVTDPIRGIDTWYGDLLNAVKHNQLLPQSLPEDSDIYTEKNWLTATQLSWVKQELARIDHRRLQNCGLKGGLDGWERRGWVLRPNAPKHVFDDQNGAHWKNCEPGCEDVFMLFQTLYRLAASALTFQRSIKILVERQQYFYFYPFGKDRINAQMNWRTYLYTVDDYVFERIP